MTIVTSDWSGAIRFTIAQNQTYPEQEIQQSQSPSAQSYNKFGRPVKISANGLVAVVGEPGYNSGTGKAYVYTRTGSIWTLKAQLNPSDSVPGDGFGTAVDLSDDGSIVIVGSIYNATSYNGATRTGAAYFFYRNGEAWPLQMKVRHGGAAHNDRFGVRVSISGDGTFAFISADLKDQGAETAAGAVYGFSRSGSGGSATWSQVVQINPAAGAGQQFGYGLVVSKNGLTVAICALDGSGGLTWSGGVYIFTRPNTASNVWTLHSTLYPADRKYMGLFGLQMAFSTDATTLLIGMRSTLGTYGQQSSPGVYVFTKTANVWSQHSKLRTPDGTDQNWFGASVSLSGDGNTALIGAERQDGSKGAAYIFSKSGNVWTQKIKLTDAGGLANNLFGASVSLSSNSLFALIGSPGLNANMGAVHFFN